MELAHLPYKKGRTYEEYVGAKGLKRLGTQKWRKHVRTIVEQLRTALEAEDVVIGGGNAQRLGRAPKGVRLGDNANAFAGGFRLWEPARFHQGLRSRRDPKQREGVGQCSSE
jgi:polyphosphate glucokinase